MLSGALVAGLAVLVGLLVVADTRLLLLTIAAVDFRLILLPFAFSLISYLAMARSYEEIAHGAGAPLSFWEMFKITLVANTVNYVVTTGGLSGFAVRMYFFVRRSVPSGTAVIISLVQTFITNIVLVFFLAVGFAVSFALHDARGMALPGILALVFLVIPALAIASLLLVHRQVRRRTIFLMAEAAHWFLHRYLPRHKPARVRVWRFQRNLNRGIEFVLARKRSIIMPVVWIAIDWVATMLILYSAFHSVGHPVSMTAVIIGFTVGVLLSLVSFVPGGLGVMEGSMAAVFTSMAVPLETALVAVLIFRVAYYVMPMVTSVFLFRPMLMQGARAAPIVLEPES